ncbi:MAG: BPSS1780 family membrane protein [Burkholderiaceae bacterium]
MEKTSATVGWLWVKEGFALYRKQPAEMSTLFLGYMFLMLAIGIIPVAGQILPLILVPTFSMSFMQACVQIEQGKRVYPNLLLAGFRSPAFPALVKLGVLYLLAAGLSLGASSLLDGGVFWKVMTGQIELDAKVVRETNLVMPILLSAAVYTPAAMAFWYAAPLVAWQKMSIGKSIFYSFFAVQRSGRAFLVYGLAWALIGVIVPAIVSAILALIFGKSSIAIIFLLPLSIILTVVMYCSFYPTYTYIFGKPHDSPSPDIQ